MKNYLLFLLLTSFIAQAQYTTPNNGETITLSDLILVEPAVVILTDTDQYTLNADLVISANDTLLIDEPITLKINPEVLITIEGTWHTRTNILDNRIIITAQNPENPHQGFRFEEGSFSNFSNTSFQYGGGFKVLSENFLMNNCDVTYQFAGASTGAAISFSRGTPYITNSTFSYNELPAVASGANQSVALKFIGNTLEYNGQSNANRSQINMGASTANDSIMIVDNIILGDRNLPMVGGIAVANFFGGVNHVVIRNNHISDNRYGITLVGPVTYGEIDNNIIENNNSQGNPDLGGSGINLNAGGETISQTIYVKNNVISNNLWGITMQGNAYANLGDGTELSPGGNIFSENGFDGINYAFYNNTPNDIMAQGNCWIAGQESTEEEVAAVITDQADIASLGVVDYSNFGCNLSVSDVVLNIDAKMYPNPTKDVVYLEMSEKGSIEFYNQLGQLVHKANLESSKNELKLNLPRGLYFLKIKTDNQSIYKKLLVK